MIRGIQEFQSLSTQFLQEEPAKKIGVQVLNYHGRSPVAGIARPANREAQEVDK